MGFSAGQIWAGLLVLVVIAPGAGPVFARDLAAGDLAPSARVVGDPASACSHISIASGRGPSRLLPPCEGGVSGASDHAPPGEQVGTQSAGFASGLSGQKPVRFRRAAMLGHGAVLVLASHGPLQDPVRLLRGPEFDEIQAKVTSSALGTLPAWRPTNRPVWSQRLTSGFGLRRHPVLGGVRAHSGIDFAAPAGSPIFATSDGVVGAASWQGGYGLAVTLMHGSGVETRYAHMSRLNVRAGQQIKAGDVLGYVGSTGRSTGPHLHYELRYQGRAVDPARAGGGR